MLDGMRKYFSRYKNSKRSEINENGANTNKQKNLVSIYLACRLKYTGSVFFRYLAWGSEKLALLQG